MTDTDLAWVAGIIEGEGCIRIAVTDITDSRSKKRLKSRAAMCVIVGMKDKTIIQRLYNWFGGYFQVRKKGMYCWTLSSNPARIMLEDILPYLVGDKRPQAELAIEFQLNKTPGHRTIEQHLWELDAAKRISAMKYKETYNHAEP